MFIRRFLYSPNPEPGDGGQPAAEATQTAAQINAGQTGHGDSNAGPAAAAVAAGTRSEREVNLEAELASERANHATTAAEKKDREQRINDLEDELRRVKAATTEPRRQKRERTSLTLFRLRED